MGLFDAFKLWRGGPPAGPGTPSAPVAAPPSQPAAPSPSTEPPAAADEIAEADVPDSPSPQDPAGIADISLAAPDAPSIAADPVTAPLIHDDADPDALQRALDEDLYGGPERRRRHRVNARPGTRVLIVDDSVTIVAVLRKMLQQNGYETLEAYTAEKALELIAQETPELVFLDIVLPGMDGFSALRAMRRHPVTKSVPIIMISGNAQATEQFYVQRIGADDFMKKPFTRAEVFARIERLLDEEGVPRRQAAPPRPAAT